LENPAVVGARVLVQAWEPLKLFLSLRDSRNIHHHQALESLLKAFKRPLKGLLNVF